MDIDLINDISDYQEKIQLTDTDFALYIGMKKSLYGQNKNGTKPVGLTLIRAVYKNVPHLRASVDNWLLGNNYKGHLPAHVALSIAWKIMTDRLDMIIKNSSGYRTEGFKGDRK